RHPGRPGHVPRHRSRPAHARAPAHPGYGPAAQEWAMSILARFRHTHASGSGMFSGLILRTVLGIMFLALAINDGGKLVSAQVRAESVARAAATAGADTWFRTHRADLARQDAI